ncbi:MAG: response regulator transcription factor [Chloroflexota bacterium]
MSTDYTLRILIIAEDPLARAGLAALLADQPGYLIVGQLDEATTLLEDINVYQPDVLLWDLGWNPESILAVLPDVIALELPLVTLLPDETHVVDVWQAGGRGCLLRTIQEERLLTALSAVAQGIVALDPLLADALITTSYADQTQPTEALTPREIEVLQLLAEGLSNKLIARQLDISEHTVKFHVNAILGKLGAQSRTEAVVRATRLGLILL